MRFDETCDDTYEKCDGWMYNEYWTDLRNQQKEKENGN